MLRAKITSEDVPALYSFWAPLHDVAAHFLESKARSVAIDLLDVTNGQRILDIGTGTGLNMEPLLKRNPAGMTVGIDRTPAMLKRAFKRLDRYHPASYRLFCGDARYSLLPSGRFDRVISTYMLDMMSAADIDLVLNEAWRVLKPGGRIVLANLAVAERWPGKLWDSLYQLNPRILGGCRGIATTSALVNAGFVNNAGRYISQHTFPTEVNTGRKPYSQDKTENLHAGIPSKHQ